jgi:hypothetical protein
MITKSMVAAAVLLSFSASAFAGSELNFGFNENLSNLPNSSNAGTQSNPGFNLGYEYSFGKMSIFGKIKDGKRANIEQGGVSYTFNMGNRLFIAPDLYVGRMRVGTGHGNGNTGSGVPLANPLTGVVFSTPTPISNNKYNYSYQKYNTAYANYAGIGTEVGYAINNKTLIYGNLGIADAFGGKIAGQNGGGFEYQTGLGATYAFTKAWAVNTSYNLYALNINGNSATSNNLGVGLIYKW